MFRVQFLDLFSAFPITLPPWVISSSLLALNTKHMLTFPNYISIPNLVPEPQTHTFSCIPGTSTWVSLGTSDVIRPNVNSDPQLLHPTVPSAVFSISVNDQAHPSSYQAKNLGAILGFSFFPVPHLLYWQTLSALPPKYSPKSSHFSPVPLLSHWIKSLASLP